MWKSFYLRKIILPWEFIILPSWGFHSTEFILLPICGHIYLVQIRDVYLTNLDLDTSSYIWWKLLTYEARIISLHLSVSKLSLSRVHHDTLMKHQTPEAQYITLYLLQSSVYLQHTWFVSRLVSVDSQYHLDSLPLIQCTSLKDFIPYSGSTSTTTPSTALKLMSK